MKAKLQIPPLIKNSGAIPISEQSFAEGGRGMSEFDDPVFIKLKEVYLENGQHAPRLALEKAWLQISRLTAELEQVRKESGKRYDLVESYSRAAIELRAELAKAKEAAEGRKGGGE